MTKLIRFLKDDSGATAIEYGLLASLIAVVLIGVVATLGTTLEAKFSDIASSIKNAGTSTVIGRQRSWPIARFSDVTDAEFGGVRILCLAVLPLSLGHRQDERN